MPAAKAPRDLPDITILQSDIHRMEFKRHTVRETDADLFRETVWSEG